MASIDILFFIQPLFQETLDLQALVCQIAFQRHGFLIYSASDDEAAAVSEAAFRAVEVSNRRVKESSL